MSRITKAGAGSLVLFAALTSSALGSGAEAAPTAASGKLVGQTTYKCEANTPPAGRGEDSVGVRMNLDAPATVKPGDRLSLKGTLSLQFSEKTRQAASSNNVQSIDSTSTTVTVVAKIGSTETVIKADRWQTGPTAPGNPLVLTAPISFAPFTVPAGASGTLELLMPTKDRFPTNVPDPKYDRKVAITFVSVLKAPLGTFTNYIACWYPPGGSVTFGRIPIASAAAPRGPASGSTGAGTPANPSGSSAAAPGGAAQPGATTAGADGAPVGQGSPADGQTPIDSGQPTTTAGTLVNSPAVDPSRRGVYVPTSLLVLGGFLICLGSLSYAVVAEYRLRTIRRAVEQ